MNTITVEELKRDVDAALEQSGRDHQPVVIDRKGGEAVVLMSASDLRRCIDDPGMAETMHLLSSPGNARHLERSIEQANRGELILPDPAIFKET